MRILIKQVHIKQFKGIVEKQLSFSEDINHIFGRNGSGKTSVLDAIIWCLFGKDLDDKKKFYIIPINPDQTNQKVDPEVSMQLQVDDRVYDIRKKVKGSVSTCEIDGAPKKIGEFDDFIAGLFGSEERFKMFSMPLYFPDSLHWTRQRELLMQFFPDPDPSQVFARMAVENICCSQDMVEALKKMSPSDYAAKHEKELKECDAKKIRLDAQIELLDNQLEGNHGFDAESMTAERDNLRQLVADHSEKLKTSNDYNTKIEKAKASLVAKRDNLQREIRETEYNANLAYQRRKSELEHQINDQKNILKQKRSEFLQIKDRKTDLTCQFCGNALPNHMVIKSSEALKNQKTAIAEAGKAAQLRLTELEGELERWAIQQTKPDTSAQVAQIAEIDQKLSSLPAIQPVQALDQDIYSRLDDLNKALARADVHQENIERKEKLEADERRLNQEMEQHQIAIREAGLYIFYRSAVVVDKINQHFKTISVKVFDVQKNGVTKETFEITSNGVPYSGLNSTGKLQAGLELTNFLKDKLGVETPIIIDNGERYTDLNLSDIKGQIIIAVAKKGAKLEVA